jgi:hypothetical protein
MMPGVCLPKRVPASQNTSSVLSYTPPHQQRPPLFLSGVGGPPRQFPSPALKILCTSGWETGYEVPGDWVPGSYSNPRNAGIGGKTQPKSRKNKEETEMCQGD